MTILRVQAPGFSRGEVVNASPRGMRWAAAVVACGAAVLLTACSHAPTNADGTLIVEPGGEVSLFATPKLTTAPVWEMDAAALPEGWAAVTVDGEAGLTEGQAEALRLQLAFNPPPVYNADKSCYVQANTLFQPSFQVGRGDLYLTKQALYSSADSTFSPVSGEATWQLATGTGGHIVAFGGRIAAPGPLLSGTDGTSSAAAGGAQYVVARAVDQLVTDPLRGDAPKVELSAEQIAAGMSIVGEASYDTSKGLPTAVVTVSCVSGAALDRLDVQALLDAFTWRLS